ncbi:hypothetical protein FACS1894218_6620 [Bacilli bacterium]|nr:hypothetical protein FACS1894218_6620 [Bacilli bacterium]
MFLGTLASNKDLNSSTKYVRSFLVPLVLTKTEREHLVSNIAGHLGKARSSIQYRQTALFYKADKDYGTAVAKALNLNVKHVTELSKLSQDNRVKATL